MKVFVYRNLHKQCWSVKALEGPDKGRVIDHCNEVCIANPHCSVSESGRQRVLREKRKNVHAGIKGEYGKSIPHYMRVKLDSRRITYNPYKYGTFVYVDNLEKASMAMYAQLCDDGGVLFLDTPEVN